jgi:hypothetical protein
MYRTLSVTLKHPAGSGRFGRDGVLYRLCHVHVVMLRHVQHAAGDVAGLPVLDGRRGWGPQGFGS